MKHAIVLEVNTLPTFISFIDSIANTTSIISDLSVDELCNNSHNVAGNESKFIGQLCNCDKTTGGGGVSFMTKLGQHP